MPPDGTKADVAPAPWQRVPARTEAPRREPITREAIVEAALRLLDRDGLDALSMRRLAGELDTGAASLYWHVGSKDGLLDLLFDRVIGEQEVPEPDPERWQEQLKEVARTMRAAIGRHPDIVRISIGRVPTGAHALRYMERVLGILRGGGVPNRLAVTGAHLLSIVVNGFSLEEPGVPSAAVVDGAAPDFEKIMSDYFASLPVASFPNLVAVADEFTAADMDERFELLLDVFVEGLASRARV